MVRQGTQSGFNQGSRIKEEGIHCAIVGEAGGSKILKGETRGLEKIY